MEGVGDIPVLGPALPGESTADLAQAVQAAWQALGRPPGRELTVAVNDPQRGTDTPAVLAELARQAGGGFRLLIACGSHRFDQDTRRTFERRLTAGLFVAEVAWHDAAAAGLIDIADRWRGHPWLGDGPVLAVGSVEPHYFAGFSGAHKTLTIGLASWSDIQANHANALSPAARPTRLAGNPVHEGIAAMLRALAGRQRVAAVNLVQAGTDVFHACGGEPLATLAAAAEAAGNAFVCSIPSPADAIIAQVTGPLECSFYQAEKGIKNSEWAVRDGGAIVLVADCTEGVGQDHFLGLLRQAPTAAAAEAIVAARGYRLGDHKAIKLRHLTDPARRGVRVLAVCRHLPPADAAVLGVLSAESVEGALAKAGVDLKTDRVYRVEDAGNVCVVVH